MSPRKKTGSSLYETIPVAILPLDKRCRKQKYIKLDSGSLHDDPAFLESLPKRQDSRREARRDHDRIYYTSAWRRLAGVTQVISPEHEETPLHNRMTHSEKVALAAWSIASNIISSEDEDKAELVAKLGGMDLDIAATAALAHDLGHAPFGHIGEEELDKWAAGHGLIDGFEGNAQTFRIVTRLARWSNHNSGLKLTLGTLTAIAKYPWVRGADKRSLGSLPTDYDERREELEHRRRDDAVNTDYHRYWRKYGAYTSEAILLREARTWMPESFLTDGSMSLSQSLEASVMDCADDIAYAVHDLEDFAESDSFDFDRIRDDCKKWCKEGKRASSWCDRVKKKLKEDYPERFNSNAFDDAVLWLAETLEIAELAASDDKRRRRGTQERRQATRTTKFLKTFLDADQFVINNEPLWDNGPLLTMTSTSWHRVNLLKSITMDVVVNSPLVSAHQISARKVVRDLADGLYDWVRMAEKADKDELPGLPHELRAMLLAYEEEESGIQRTEADNARCVIDYICFLSDHSVRVLAARLNGQGTNALVGTVL